MTGTKEQQMKVERYLDFTLQRLHVLYWELYLPLAGVTIQTYAQQSLVISNQNL